MNVSRFAVVLLLVVWLVTPVMAMHPDAHKWNDTEKALLKALWLGSLGPVPDDPSNDYDTDPVAVRLGRKLFFDTRLSANGKVACSTCHIPGIVFTDNLPVAHGIDDTTRRSMPLAGTAYSPWLFWDGRADSLWAQALGPFESAVEHGISRTKCALIVREHYRMDYESIFGTLPDLKEGEGSPTAKPDPDDQRARSLWEKMSRDQRREISRLYANIGKCIAAYVRTIMPGPSDFDRYVEAVLNDDQQRMEKVFTPDEAVGLKIFISRGCINCHNGPLLTNNDFHRVGVEQTPGFDLDRGRAVGIQQVLDGEFNCLSEFSDAGDSDCAELRFIDRDTAKYEGAFKTPSLRNVADRPPYMHAGQLKSLREVLLFYQKNGVPESGAPGRSDIIHGRLADSEIDLLEGFLRTLNGPVYAAQ